MQKGIERHMHKFKRNKATANAPFRFVWSGLPNVYLTGIRYDLCACGIRQGFYPCVTGLLDVLTKLVVEKKSRLSPLEIRYVRKSLRKNHEKFARLIGVSVTQVSRWENGRSTPSLPTEKLIRHLAGADGKDLERLMRAPKDESYLLCFRGRGKWGGKVL
jgi:DNA-binding transcriptional regulator YiaG